MSCELCKDVIERPDLPHVIRRCEGCGREMRIHEPGEHGRGFKVRAGDRPVIPAGWLKFSLNPLKGSGQFTRQGIALYAEQIRVDGLPSKKDDMQAELERLAERNLSVLRGSQLLDGPSAWTMRATPTRSVPSSIAIEARLSGGYFGP